MWANVSLWLFIIICEYIFAFGQLLSWSTSIVVCIKLLMVKSWPYFGWDRHRNNRVAERRRFADVSAASSAAATATQLPTWQQNASTCWAFCCFYLILFQRQPRKGGSPTWKDAPTRIAAVSLLDCCQPLGGCISHKPDLSYLQTCCRSISAISASSMCSQSQSDAVEKKQPKTCWHLIFLI